MATSTDQTAARDGDWHVGPLTPDDLDAVVAIDRAAAGRSRRRFFERRLAAALAEPGRFVYVGVRHGGQLAGYVLARLTDGEFGAGTLGATLDAIGVAEGQSGRGVGSRLLAGVEAVLKHKGVTELVTEVDWGDQALLHFFEHGGFALAPRVVLARDTATPLNL